MYIESNQIIKMEYQVFLISNISKYNIHIKITYDLSQNVAEMKAFQITVPPTKLYYEHFQIYRKVEGIVQLTPIVPQLRVNNC